MGRTGPSVTVPNWQRRSCNWRTINHVSPPAQTASDVRSTTIVRLLSPICRPIYLKPPPLVLSMYKVVENQCLHGEQLCITLWVFHLRLSEFPFGMCAVKQLRMPCLF